MGIDSESDTEANLQIGPTSLGMVRIYVESGDRQIPMDFDPDEADEIAEEIRAAAALARKADGSPSRSAGRGAGRGGGARKGGR